MSSDAVQLRDVAASYAAQADARDVPFGYKRSDVGLIPVDWDVDRVDKHALIKTGARNTQDRIADGQYPFFVRSQHVERIDSYSYDGEAVLTAGDGVGTGKVYHYINGRFDVHQRVYRITDFSSRLDGRYFFSQFSTRFYDRIMSMTAKSSVDSVRMEMIAGMLLPLPNPAEQRAIAEVLSDVDGLLGASEALIAKKRAIKQATMQQLLTGKTRLPGFSGEWEIKSLSELLVDGPTNGYSPGSGAGATGTLTLRLAATTSGKLILNENTVKRLSEGFSPAPGLFLRPGDILVQRSNTLDVVGTTAYFDGPPDAYVYPDLLMRLRFPEDVTARWFWSYANSAAGRSYFHAAAAGSSGSMPKISGTSLRRMCIPYPSLAEQAAIANTLSDMDTEIASLEARRDKTRAIKQGMMQQLLTGRVRLLGKSANNLEVQP